MKHSIHHWCLIAGCGILIGMSLPNGANGAGLVREPPRKSFVEGEVLVRFRDDKAASQRIAGLVGIQVVRLTDRIQRIRLKAGQTVAAAVSRLAADPAVAHVQPNYLYHAVLRPNDPDYGQLWGLENSGQTITNAVYATGNPGTPGADLDAVPAWDISTDCRDAVVAVLDTGIDYTHPDLVANMWDGGTSWPNHGWDFVGAGDNDPRPVGAAEHHGTHVAGIIAATGNNGRGSVGVCWRAQVMAVRVLDATGIGTTADIIEGVRFAVDRGARVINMSLAGEGPYDQFYAEAIDYARQKDVLVVVAAGNGGNDGVGDDVQVGEDQDSNGNPVPSTKIYPCAFPHDNLLCVAALDQTYAIASFSNFGTNGVDLGAPGTNVHSSLPGRVRVDDFSGWAPVPTGGWTATSCNVGYGNWSMLVNPSNWCPPTGSLPSNPYATDANDVIYKMFDLSSSATAVAASLTYYAFMDVVAGDGFEAAYDATGGNPFGGNGITLQASLSGEYLPNPVAFEHSLDGCLTANCAIGFRLRANGDTTVGTGMGVFYLAISTLEPGSDLYGLYNGTSMASPYVAGVAALVRAYNPDYTYADAMQAIIEGGDPAAAGFAGKSETDKSVNMLGALRYLAPPENVTLTVN